MISPYGGGSSWSFVLRLRLSERTRFPWLYITSQSGLVRLGFSLSGSIVLAPLVSLTRLSMINHTATVNLSSLIIIMQWLANALIILH